ncbi:MAG: helix-turn-helix domain-containing protein [Candidatus Binataceae bacterium]
MKSRPRPSRQSEGPSIAAGERWIEPRFLTVEEAARFLRVSISTIYRMAEGGRIPCFKVGKCWRFTTSEIIAWSRGLSAQPAGAAKT